MVKYLLKCSSRTDSLCISACIRILFDFSFDNATHLPIQLKLSWETTSVENKKIYHINSLFKLFLDPEESPWLLFGGISSKLYWNEDPHSSRIVTIIFDFCTNDTLSRYQGQQRPKNLVCCTLKSKLFFKDLDECDM